MPRCRIGVMSMYIASAPSPMFGRCRLMRIHQCFVSQLQHLGQRPRIDRMGIAQRVRLVQQLPMVIRWRLDQRIGVLEEVVPLWEGYEVGLLSEHGHP